VRMAAATALSGLLPPVRGPVVESWVARDPADWRTRIPFLSSPVEAGRTEFVVDWIRRARATSPAAAMAGIETLHATGGPGVLGLLVELAGDPDLEVQAAAIRGLAGQWDRVGDADLERLVELFDQALRRGIPSPGDGDRERMVHLPAAAAAAAALGHPAAHGFGAMAVLEEAYLRLDGVSAGEARSASPGRGAGPDAVTLLREAVLLALGNLGDPGAIPLLETAREDSTPAIRRAAGEALEQLTGVRARGLNLPAVERGLDPERLRALGPEPRWILETDRGEIVVRLVPGQAPLTVQTVAELTEAGAYDDTAFHRVIGNFVAQGGDVSLRDGTGTPGFAIRSEWTQIPFVRGVVGMASAGKDTEGSQFFLTHASQPHLDGAFTAFGWVESGGDVMDRIMPGDRLLRARVVSTDGSPGPSPRPR
jgi:cyclophilin family peptidyl-prolyl cis-trans isomerase